MALFNFGKKKDEEKKTPACGCSVGEAGSITNDCCPDLKEGEICCIKVLGAGCKSCHEQYENAKQAVKDMDLSVFVFITPAEVRSQRHLASIWRETNLISIPQERKPNRKSIGTL